MWPFNYCYTVSSGSHCHYDYLVPTVTVSKMDYHRHQIP